MAVCAISHRCQRRGAAERLGMEWKRKTTTSKCVGEREVGSRVTVSVDLGDERVVKMTATSVTWAMRTQWTTTLE